MDDFIDASHSEKLYEAYAGDKVITKFEGDHNSQRPQFFYDSGSIFFHNVLMVDSIVNELEQEKASLVRQKTIDLLDGEKLPEFDSTKFRKISKFIESEENEDLYKFDESIGRRMKHNQKREIRKRIKEENKETASAILKSMNSYLNEKEEEEHVIDALERIGIFKQLSYEGDLKNLASRMNIGDEEVPLDDKEIIDELNDRDLVVQSDPSIAETNS